MAISKELVSRLNLCSFCKRRLDYEYFLVCNDCGGYHCWLHSSRHVQLKVEVRVKAK